MKYINDKLNQKGIVSFLTVTFLAAILLLITVGFTKVMLSNQRQSLDGQLNTQAFYAAESGINDVLTNYTTLKGAGVFNKTGCNDVISQIPRSPTGLAANILDPTEPDIKYTCLLVDDKTEFIEFSDATSTSGKLYKLKNAAGNAISNIRISWGNEDEIDKRGDLLLPPQGDAWPETIPPLLRVTIYYPGSNFSRPNLITSQKTFFLIPYNGFGSTSDVSPEDGKITGIRCDEPSTAPYRCIADINISSYAGSASQEGDGGLFIRIRPIYDHFPPPTIEIKDMTGGGSSTNYFEDAQYTIDSTGRANDVYKRIKVTVDINDNVPFPEYGVLSGGNLCKQFIAWPDNPPPSSSFTSGYEDESDVKCSF